MASPGCDPLHHLCHRNRHHRHHHCHHHHLLHLHHHLHHHCHHRFSPCAFHTNHIHCRRQGFYNVTPIPPNPESIVPFPMATGNNSYGEAVEYKDADISAAQISQELEHLDLDEEEDEPVFVLTDEWREFFAKSEAKRQQEKKQRKKGKK